MGLPKLFLICILDLDTNWFRVSSDHSKTSQLPKGQHAFHLKTKFYLLISYLVIYPHICYQRKILLEYLSSDEDIWLGVNEREEERLAIDLAAQPNVREPNQRRDRVCKSWPSICKICPMFMNCSVNKKGISIQTKLFLQDTFGWFIPNTCDIAFKTTTF